MSTYIELFNPPTLIWNNCSAIIIDFRQTGIRNANPFGPLARVSQIRKAFPLSFENSIHFVTETVAPSIET